MEETRAQAYQQLIQTFLTCPKVDEPQILQDNSELLDRGFLQACEVIAENLTQQGQENAARFLRNLASQLGQFLDTKDDGDSDNSESEDSQEYANFILELLQAESDSNSDIKVIYPMLAERQHLLNHRFAEILQQLAENLIAEHPEEIESIVALIGNLSIHISGFPLGSRANNIEIAITGYQIVLNNLEPGSKNFAQIQFARNLACQIAELMDGSNGSSEDENHKEYAKLLLELLQTEASNGDISYTKVTYPMLEGRQHLLNSRFAQILQQVSQRLITENPETIEFIVALIENLSIHISEYPDGNRENNIEIAITGYQIVLSNREPGSEKFAQTQYNLANDYSNRIKGSRADNLERAIEFYQAALTVRTLEDFPEYWANTQNSLAAAYTDRIKGLRADNFELAIACYQAALTIYTFDDFRETWANTQNSLAAAYTDRIKGSRADNLELAIEFYQTALTVYTFEDFPKKWAMIQNNLANAYKDRISGLPANNLEQAIEFCKAALRVFTFEDFPENWANTQNSLAAAYTNRINGSRADNLERAIELYQAALKVYTFEDFPEQSAMAQNNLANVYKDIRIKGSRADNLELAIELYQAALKVYTFEYFPKQWANTQDNLAVSYRDRIKGSRADNLELAIGFCQAALTVCTLDDFPEQWANTQNNIAICYTDRSINGSGEDDLELAIGFFQAALTVYTFENFPKEWANTQNNLAVSYKNRSDGINGSWTDTEKAIELYQAALRVYTFEDFPEQWAHTQNNLAIAYKERTNGSQADNLELAIDFYQKALIIRTRKVFPQYHAATLYGLSDLYRSDQQWQLAYDNYALAIETVEFLRGEESGDENKQKLAEEWNKVYRDMVKVCIQLQRYTEAVEYADRSKAQNLIELLSVRDLYPKGEIPPEVRQDLQQLRLKIAEENQRLKQAEEKNYDTINRLRQDLAAKYPYIPLKFDDIKQLFDETTAIIEWYILGSLGDIFCAFIITNKNSQPQFLSFSHLDLRRLSNWANEYLVDYYSNRQQWQNSLGTKLANLAQILHIDEILAAIPEVCDKLILIPHLYLHLFPIHALPVSGENWQRFHRDNENCPLHPCLVDCFDNGVSYTPSCQILHQVQKYKRGKFDKLFAIQNPTDDLMAADMEVETIKNIFPNSETRAKEDAKKGAKSEETLEIAERVTDSHHLFFSCHGYFNPNDPLQSGLQLADGILTLEEIIRYFNLSECSLVTLSACETGQVKLDKTDEYISLTSGFLLAGSPSLYVTLWSVNAFSTAILLIKTYENLYQQPGKLALALNQAQIWVRDTDIQGFLDWTNQCHLLDDTWREILQECLEEEKTTQGVCAKIYQNPYHWAGFCAAGKGEQNMANSITPLEIFQELIQESDLFVNLREDLIYLKGQLTNNDEENIKIVETWLQDKPEIRRKYRSKLMNSGDKLGNKSQSGTKPGQATKSLRESIENLTIPVEKPPEATQNTQPSP